MKKLTAIILVLVLTCSFAGTAFASEGPYKPTLLNGLNYSIAEWTDSDYMCSMAAWIALLDYISAANVSDTSGYNIYDSYVGTYGTNGLDIFIATTSGYCNLVWYPSSGEMYRYDFTYTSSQLESKYPGYNHNSSTSLQTAYEVLTSAFNSDN